MTTYELKFAIDSKNAIRIKFETTVVSKELLQTMLNEVFSNRKVRTVLETNGHELNRVSQYVGIEEIK